MQFAYPGSSIFDLIPRKKVNLVKAGSLDHIGPGILTFLYRKVSETLFTGVCEPETDGRIHPDERSSEGSPSLKTFSTPDERNDIGISCQSIIFRIL